MNSNRGVKLTVAFFARSTGGPAPDGAQAIGWIEEIEDAPAIRSCRSLAPQFGALFFHQLREWTSSEGNGFTSWLRRHQMISVRISECPHSNANFYLFRRITFTLRDWAPEAFGYTPRSP